MSFPFFGRCSHNALTFQLSDNLWFSFGVTLVGALRDARAAA